MADVGGRPVAFESPEEFEEMTKDYIQWVKSNPVLKTITAAFQGEISYKKVPHSRPMTQYGWAAHLNIGLSTLKDYSKKPEFSAIFNEYQAYMTSWNIDGATCGDLNGSIIARIEGLADKQQLEHSGSISDMSDDELDKAIAEKMAKVNE